MLLYGEYPDVAPNAVLFAAAKPAGREGNGGGADGEFITAVWAVGAATIVVRAEVIVGAGVGVTAEGADKGVAAVAAIHPRKLAMQVEGNNETPMRRNDCRAWLPTHSIPPLPGLRWGSRSHVLRRHGRESDV